jgi:hypothetical protein
MRTLTEVGHTQAATRHKSPDSQLSLNRRLPLDRLLEAKALNGRQREEFSHALFPRPRLVR